MKLLLTTSSIFVTISLLVVIVFSCSSFTTALAPRIKFDTLGMKMQFQALTAAEASASEDTMEIVFESSDNGGYLSMGYSYGVMTGRLLGCQYPSAGASSATCVEMDGDGYDADNVASTHTVTSASNTGGVASITIRIPMASFGVTAAQGMRRVIFARGEWEDGTMDDHGSEWSQVGVDIWAGTYEQYGPSTPWTYLTLFCAWLVSMLTALVGAAMKQCHQRSGRKATWAMQIAVWVVFIGCFIAVVIEAHSEFRKIWAPAPIARALGAGCAYMFSLIMFPTTRHLNIGYIAGASYDRFISFHVLGGWILFIVVLVHGIWFIVVSASPEGGSFIGILGNFGSEGTIPVLPAVIGFVFFIFLFVVAALRNYVSYYWFRISHYTFPIVIIGFAIHYPPVAVCIAPGLILWIVDFVLRFIRPRYEDPQITAVEVDDSCKVVKLVVTLHGEDKSRWAAAHPGQYAFFSITSISELPHPFTFIHRSRDGSEITFLIRASGHFTEHLYLAAKSNPSETLIKKPGILRNFTGPVGIPEVDITHPTDIVLVAGGIGITATQGLLFDLVEKFEDAAAKKDEEGVVTPAALTINFVWSVREVELYNMVEPYIVECAQRLAAVAPNVRLVAKIFITSIKDDSSASLPQNKDTNIFMLHAGKRPSHDVDMSPIETRADGIPAYFSCGPVPLMESANQAASSRGALIHEEVFNF